MLQEINGGVCETIGNSTVGVFTAGYGDCGNKLTNGAYIEWPYQTVWNAYPVYVCTDKTAKSIEILKRLEEDKILKVTSVKKFIELVQKISSIL